MNRDKINICQFRIITLFLLLHPYPRWFMPEGLFQIVFLFYYNNIFDRITPQHQKRIGG